MVDDYTLKLKLGLPVPAHKGHKPIGYVLDKSRKIFYPKQDELELLLEVSELYENGAMSCSEIAAYLKEKADIVVTRETVRRILLTRAPYKVIKESLDKRKETYAWMSQNLT